MTMARQPSRRTPLRQPFTVPDVVHRTSRLERALHQVECFDDYRLLVAQGTERRFEAREIARPRVARRAPQREVGAKRPRLGRETERRELPLHLVLQQLERGLRRDPDPDDARPLEVGKHTEAPELERQGPGPGRGAGERGAQLPVALLVHLAQELEREMNPLGAHPFHGQPAVPQRRRRLPESLPDLRREIECDEEPQTAGLVSRDRKSTRLNSSHGYISYAVFCLKKKKKKRNN